MKQINQSKRIIILFAMVFALIAILSIQMTGAQTSGTAVSVSPQISTGSVGETFTVNITLSNVQNLYGLDVTLNWNVTVLQIVSATSRLGVESNPGGVLHEPVSTVENSVSQTAGEYHLVATSQNPADSFNGSGTIAIVTFNVTKLGHTGLDLHSEPADHPLPDEVSVLIDHTDVSGSFDAVIPEFPGIFAVAMLVAVATVGLLFSKKLFKKNRVPMLLQPI